MPPLAPDTLPGWRKLMGDHAGLFAAVFVFSILVNALMLTGPVFMLQLYERVLPAQSGATLVVLFALVGFLYAIMAVLDHVRGRLMARVGARFQSRYDAPVLAATLRGHPHAAGDDPPPGQRDLETVQRVLGAPVAVAPFDLVWTPVFLGLIFLFHPELGALALIGTLVLVALALGNSAALVAPMRRAQRAGERADSLGARLVREGEVVRALGMAGHGLSRWYGLREAGLQAIMQASDRGGLFTSLTKAFRLFLQSAMLAMGGWLVLRAELSAGAMIAGSIILGRALAPVEQLVGQWGLLAAAAESMTRLRALLARTPPQEERLALPRPRPALEVSALAVVPPGAGLPTLRGVEFRLQPGQALGVIGASGAGKSTLARALLGLWPPVAGKVRLDGVALDHFAPDVLGRWLGYLPQHVAFFPGTIAQNIARLTPDADPAAVIRAAERAGAHQMILRLPRGYETELGHAVAGLSGGQMQRIALARALYGDPVLLVLDEPNAHLDLDGANALNAAIRSQKQAGGAVIVMAHRPAAILECDCLLMLDAGQQVAFGPRDTVLRRVLHPGDATGPRAVGAGP